MRREFTLITFVATLFLALSAVTPVSASASDKASHEVWMLGSIGLPCQCRS